MKPEDYNTVKWMDLMSKITGMEKMLKHNQTALNLCLLTNFILLIAFIAFMFK